MTSLLQGTALLLVVVAGCASSPPATSPDSVDPDVTKPTPTVADAGPDHDREPGAVHAKFKDPDKWSKHFDHPGRDSWQKPDQVIAYLALSPDSTVADVGAGTGYFTVRVAPHVPNGRVFAVELEPEMIAHIEKRAEDAGLANVVGVRGFPDDPKIPQPVDVVLIVNTYHHIQDRVPYFQRLTSSLSENGRLVIVDWKMGDLPVGPKDPHKISQFQATRELEKAGFELCSSFDDLPHQYVRTFAPVDTCAGKGDTP